jgi:predicted ATPase/class 3 adenylate cyclase
MSEFKTLLLTDVVDSTKLSEVLGDEFMARVWVSHDRVARDLLAVWRGREIDKTDGLLLMFDSASDAAGYAMAYHAALTTLPVPLKARAGIHCGVVILRENSPEDIARGAKPLEVDGLAKPFAARVMSLARGGQTLVSAAAIQALADKVQRSQSHGHWLMKGISEPMELFEIGSDETEFMAPAESDKVRRVVSNDGQAHPQRQVPNNLPQQLNPLIGRERELADIRQKLQSVRLLTLLGMGGMGKTRLALQVASELMSEFPDGVWFIDLAPIRDPELVVVEAAQVLGVREEPGRSLQATLAAHLKPLRALIVLDNCEHVLTRCAELAHGLMRYAPGVHVLSSSRELLHVPGEQAYPILPLPLPARNDGFDGIASSAAVRLFVDRVKSQRPGFELNEREAPAIAELVSRLEGIPLALELAAARVRSLSVAEINARLSDRYRILTGGSRMLQQRQQTMRALVDWSYDLLTEDERLVFSRLAVFCGGFDLAAASAVCGADPVFPQDVLDLLDSLVEKSLIMTEHRSEQVRYRLLETIRDYARERLIAGSDERATAQRHTMHFFGFAKEASRGLRGPEQAVWIWRVEDEVDNLRSAMAFALSAGVEEVVAVKLAVALQGFWALRGYAAEGRAFVRATLALPAIQGLAMAKAHALYVGAALAGAQSDHAEACDMLEQCLALRRELGDGTDIAATLSTLGLSRLLSGDPDAADAAEHEALDLFVKVASHYGQAIGQLHLAQIDAYRGHAAAAREHLTQCLALARELGHQEIEGECERVAGQLAFETGDFAEAQRRLKRALQICRDAGDRRGEVTAQSALARCELGQGDLAQARKRLDDAVRAFRSFGMAEELLDALESLVTLLRTEGRSEDAMQVAASAMEARRRLELRRSPDGERRWQGEVAALRAAVDDAAYGAASSQTDALGMDAAIKLALEPTPEGALSG